MNKNIDDDGCSGLVQTTQLLVLIFFLCKLAYSLMTRKDHGHRVSPCGGHIGHIMCADYKLNHTNLAHILFAPKMSSQQFQHPIP